MVSWDGELHIYGSEEKFGQKDSLVGRIPVQVKSTTTDKTEKGILKYSASLMDLKNYKRDGGCIYFVIYQSPQEQVIYYELLLPYDLEKILSAEKKSKAKTKTLYLKQFPSDKKSIVALMRLFLSDKEKQFSTAKLTFDPKNPDEKAKQLIFDSLEKGIAPFSFSFLGTPLNPFENIFNAHTYVYANTTIGLQIPVQRIQVDSISSGDMPNTVLVNGVKYYDNLRVTKYKDKEIITLGKSITIELPDTAPLYGSTKINFTENGYLSERIDDNRFWLAVCSSDKCHIICGDILEGNIDKNYSTDDYNVVKERLMLLESIKNILDFFGLQEDLNIDILTEKDYNHLDILALASHGKELAINITGGFPILSNIKIANLNIYVYIESLKSSRYKIYNFFDMPKFNCLLNHGDERCRTSPYLIMKKQNLIESSNINYSIVYDSIISIPFLPLYASYVNHFLLEAISAYDEKITDILLEFINKLSAWLLEKEHSEISQLNRLQVLKRQRNLTKEEQEGLRRIANDSETLFKIGACILLESFSEAQMLWNSLSEQEIENIKSYPSFPIFNLWTQNKPNMYKYR